MNFAFVLSTKVLVLLDEVLRIAPKARALRFLPQRTYLYDVGRSLVMLRLIHHSVKVLVHFNVLGSSSIRIAQRFAPIYGRGSSICVAINKFIFYEFYYKKQINTLKKIEWAYGLNHMPLFCYILSFIRYLT